MIDPADPAMRHPGLRHAAIDPAYPVEVNLGLLCNNKCIFCMSGESRDLHEPWGDSGRIKDDIEMLFRKGGRSLIFVGGEPTVYPSLIECIGHARDTGFSTIIVDTNGARFADAGYLDDCLDAGLSRVTMSAHSHRAEIEEFLVQVPGILDKKIKAVENLVDRRQRGLLRDGIAFNPVLCRTNAPYVMDYVRFFMKMGIRDFRFNFIRPESRVSSDRTVIPTFQEILPSILRLILANEREWNVMITFGGVPPCVMPPAIRENDGILSKYFEESRKDGKFVLSFYSEYEDKSIPSYDLDSRDNVRAKVEACQDCRFNATCLGVYRGYLDLYGKDEFEAVR